MRRLSFLIALAVAAVAGVPVHAAPPPGGPRCRSFAPASPAAPADDGVRVGSLNVLHGLDDDPAGDYPGAGTLAERTSMQAEQIAAEGLDVVGLQEASVFRVALEDDPTFASEELAAALAAETGERWWSCWFLANPYFPLEPDLQEGGGGPISDFEAQLVTTFTGGPYAVFKEGIAVVSRYEIVSAEGIHLPGRLPIEIPLCVVEGDPTDPLGMALCGATAGFERRSAIWARAETPDGPVEITSTHLAHGITSASDASSLQQAIVAVAFAEAHAAAGEPAHAFFVCDCNAQPTDPVPVVGTIEAAGFTNTFTEPCLAAGDAGCTSGTDVIVTHDEERLMTERLDYVFARAGTCATNGRMVVDQAEPFVDEHGPGSLWPSDHLGVAADVAEVCIASYSLTQLL